MPRIPLIPLVPLVLLAQCLLPVPVRALVTDPSGEQLILTGAQAAGTTALSFADNVYSFTFHGDETIIYTLDLTQAKVAGGMLRIHETTSNSYPVDGLGVVFRDAAGVYTYPKDLYPKTTLLSHSMSGTTLTLDYQLDFHGLHPIRYELSMQQKALRIRALDPSGSTLLADNFSGIVFGDSTSIEQPRRILMQGTLAQSITLFQHVSGGVTKHFFVANALDMFQSNATDFDTLYLLAPNFFTSSATTGIHTGARYRAMSDGKLAKPLDDAYSVCVSSKVKDVLLTSSAPTSPYLGLLANRLFVNCPESVWSWYDSMFDLYTFLGMYDVAAYFFDWSAGAVDPPGVANVGPDWSPAFDQGAFEALLHKGRTYGNLIGASGGTQLKAV
jgi:hypothetical protein